MKSGGISKNKVSPKTMKSAAGQMVKDSIEPVKEEDEQTEDLSFRIKLETFLSGRVGIGLEIFSLSLSTISFVVHFIDSYKDGIFSRFQVVDIIIMVYYLIEYVLQFYISQHKLAFFFSNYSLMSTVTIWPLAFILAGVDITLYYKITLVLRVARIVRYLVKVFSLSKNEVSRQIYTIFLTVFSLIIIPAGIIQVFEARIRPEVVRDQM